MFNKIKLHFKRIEELESLIAESYARGHQDATTNFMDSNRKMSESMKKLSQDNIETEKRIRDLAAKRIEEIERLHHDTCSQCKQNVEEERQRLLRMQGYLATQASKVKEIWFQMFQYADLLIEEQDSVLRAAGRIKSFKDKLLSIKKDADRLEEESVPLLSLEHLTKEEESKK